MRSESLEFLETLVNTPSPSGAETRGQRVWLDYVSAFADETETDAYGNAVAWFNKGGGPRIMLAAHADEIAMCVNYIDKDGFIYVRKVGGIDPAIVKAQRVTIHAAEGPVLGVVGNVPPHLTKTQNDRKLPEMHDIFIDIGCTSEEEAKKCVRVGDMVTLCEEFRMLRGNVAVARAFDNRIGTFAVAETLRLLKESGVKIDAEVCAVSNIMEEVGLLGARQITYTLKPDAALVVDVTHATDYPTVNKQAFGDVKIGKGPALTRGGCNHREVSSRLETVAREKGIPLQFEATSNSTGTDTDVIFWTRGGIPSALISLPNRYMHSPVELVSLDDLELIPRLMQAFVESVRKDEAFKVAI